MLFRYYLCVTPLLILGLTNCMENFKISSKPYLLKNKIQNYAWGTKNEEAFISQLLGTVAEKDLPYAELWIGAHPKAPSEIMDGEKSYLLSDIIESYPAEVMGKKVTDKFGSNLPFLLKVLSANTALSIQAHPNKKLAEKLHTEDPEHYPDDNHKPEIAIALDSLKAIVGFKPIDQLVKVFMEYSELLELFRNKEVMNKLATRKDAPDEIIRSVYSEIMHTGADQLERVINKLKKRFEKNDALAPEESEFLTQYDNYGVDVGLISILLFNYITLKPGEGFYTGAGIPHAYIKGNIIECMANSDNVVRAGLTPKFKDVDTLLSMLDYTKSRPEIMKPRHNSYTYKTEASEFEITKSVINELHELKNDTLKILLVLSGKLIIMYAENETMEVTKGNSVLIPAILGNYKLSGDGAEILIAEVPV